MSFFVVVGSRAVGRGGVLGIGSLPCVSTLDGTIRSAPSGSVEVDSLVAAVALGLRDSWGMGKSWQID